MGRRTPLREFPAAALPGMRVQGCFDDVLLASLLGTLLRMTWFKREMRDADPFSSVRSAPGLRMRILNIFD